MTTLIIARHGNTFTPDQTPTRAGKHTDLPLVDSGLKQAEALGVYLAEKGLIPDAVFASTLMRTYQTAERMCEVMDIQPGIQQSDLFDEIDYGPDENKTEDEVIARIGQEAIDLWNKKAIVPDGWVVNPEDIKDGWMSFSEHVADIHQEQMVLVVTSNGVARFSPFITGDFEGFKRDHNIKLKTGALGIFEFDGENWQVMEWGIRPPST